MNSWKKLGEETVYNGWRKIIKKHFEFPNGRQEYFDIIGNNDFVSVAALTKAQEFILVRQYRPGPEECLVSFPEGYIDHGETPEQAAARELLEETGYLAGDLVSLKCRRSAYTTETCYWLLATDCEKVAQQQLDPNEFIEVFKMPLETFRPFLRDPKAEPFTNIDGAYLALDHLGLL